MPTEHDLAYSILLAPIALVPAAIVGIAIAARWRRIGLPFALISLAVLYIASTPLVSNYLIEELQPEAPKAAETEVRAIVILSGDIEHEGHGKIALGTLSLQRVFWAAEQYRSNPLPILVSGGAIEGTNVSIADLLTTALEKTFDIPVKWKETKSQTTYENAKLSSRILHNAGISSVIVVTQRWHMPRAIWAFAQFGIRAVPAKFVPVIEHNNFKFGDLIANARALVATTYAIHEIIGIRYYKYFKG